jgi:general secretion pathway protein J
MRFVADLPDYLGRGGPYLHELTITQGPDGPQLDVAFTLVLAGTTVADATAAQPEVLADKLHDAQFRYRAMTEDNRLVRMAGPLDNGDNLPCRSKSRCAMRMAVRGRR